MKSFHVLIILLFSSLTSLTAQNCSCTINQVENNTVSPCDYTIGTIVEVKTAQEFRDAISGANRNGGNMTILLADNTYKVASADSYPFISANNVVIRSKSGNRDAVILTGGGMRDLGPDRTENGIYAAGNNITIADLTIRGVGNHAIGATGENLFVHNVKLQNTYQQMLKGNAAGGGADFGTVQCSVFEYTAGIGPQFYIGGIDVHQGDNWRVNDNIFKNIASPDYPLTAEHAVHFWRNSSNNIVERNVMINCDRGVGFGLGQQFGNGNSGGIIRNNMIFNDGRHPNNDVGIGLELSPGTKVYNNTIYITYSNAIEYRFDETGNADIANNLTNKPITWRRDNGSIPFSGRTNYRNAQSNWFVNKSTGNLRLKSNYSEVVDQGTYLNDVADDINQTIRPSGNAFDIGAFEFITAVNPPSNGNNIVVNAKGNCGSENMQLSINGNVVKTWYGINTSESSYRYTYEGGGVNKVKVAFINDVYGGCDHNLFVNNIVVNGTVYETENAATREGCGSKDWLWCGGYFQFNIGGDNNNNNINGKTIIVNARGNCGSEEMQLSVNGTAVKTWSSLNIAERQYSYTFKGGTINKVQVSFTNDKFGGCDYNLYVNKITIDGTVYETENVASRVGCGSKDWLWCNGTFSFNNLNLKTALNMLNTAADLNINPNPLLGKTLSINFGVLKDITTVDISIFSTDGKLVYNTSVNNIEIVEINDLPDLTKGLYIVSATANNFKKHAKLLVQ